VLVLVPGLEPVPELVLVWHKLPGLTLDK